MIAVSAHLSSRTTGSRLGGALISHRLIDQTWHAQGESFERGILLPQLLDQNDSAGGLVRKKTGRKINSPPGLKVGFWPRKIFAAVIKLGALMPLFLS